MAAVLRIPEKFSSEILLAYKLTKSNAKLETGADLVLEVKKDTFFFCVRVSCFDMCSCIG
jgi:hypothetical protein